MIKWLIKRWINKKIENYKFQVLSVDTELAFNKNLEETKLEILIKHKEFYLKCLDSLNFIKFRLL